MQIQTSQPATFGENHCSDQSQSRSLWLAEPALISSVWSGDVVRVHVGVDVRVRPAGYLEPAGSQPCSFKSTIVVLPPAVARG